MPTRRLRSGSALQSDHRQKDADGANCAFLCLWALQTRGARSLWAVFSIRREVEFRWVLVIAKHAPAASGRKRGKWGDRSGSLLFADVNLPAAHKTVNHR